MATDTDSKVYKLSSDEGKLSLAGKYIYDYGRPKSLETKELFSTIVMTTATSGCSLFTKKRWIIKK
ncbi:UNVERIFIED_ORG: hypothetical protein ABRZ91_000861 [Heyndrickxia coagulans]